MATTAFNIRNLACLDLPGVQREVGTGAQGTHPAGRYPPDDPVIDHPPAGQTEFVQRFDFLALPGRQFGVFLVLGLGPLAPARVAPIGNAEGMIRLRRLHREGLIGIVTRQTRDRLRADREFVAELQPADIIVEYE